VVTDCHLPGPRRNAGTDMSQRRDGGAQTAVPKCHISQLT